MDIEALEFRAACIQAARDFFIQNNYLELDTPSLAETLIPETCLEVFKTEYISPNKERKELFLCPSPEVYIKKIIAQTHRSVFQLSKSYRNVESIGRIHSPEFTMLEYYTMQANYLDSIKITEKFLSFVAKKVESHILAETKNIETIKKSFETLTMDEAFKRHAGFSLAEEHNVLELAKHAERLGLGEKEKYETWAKDDLYELIFVHSVEPNLPKNKLIAILDYPAFVPCLAVEKEEKLLNKKQDKISWKTMERWELYLNGVELANCYSECRDKEKIDEYFEKENKLKQKQAMVPHPAVKNFGETCSKMPACSGVAMGFDRLIMLLQGRSTI